MGLIDKPYSRSSECFLAGNRPRARDGPVEVRLFEHISEAELKFVQNAASRIKRNRGTQRLRDRPQLVDPVTMIAVGVRHDQAIELSNLCVEQLLAQIGSAINQHPLAF